MLPRIRVNKSHEYSASPSASIASAADLAVWRPSNGEWYVYGPVTGPNQTFYQLGNSTDKAVPGDYDGDGKTDFAVFRSTNGTWYIAKSSTQDANWYGNAFGTTGDKAAQADYDGDGKTDVAVFRPGATYGTWFYTRSTDQGVVNFQFGLKDDVPAPADYDGDGKADIAVWRNSDHTFYIVRSSDTTYQSILIGNTNDKPVPADYDGDGKADAAVWSDGDALHYLVQYSANDGSNWETLASDLTTTNYTVSLDSVSGTSQGLFRVIASDGFYSALGQTNATFSINTHAPQASISAPGNNSYFVGDQNIQLSGSAYDLEDRQLGDGSLLWSSNLQGSLGSGENLSIDAATLFEGTHMITLTARDTSAQTGTSTVTIQVYRNQPPIPSLLSASPGILSYVAQQGTTSILPSHILAIRNEGDGTINWVATADQPWIQLGQTGGAAPSNPEITINPAGLALGNYSGTVRISTSDASNSPQTVDVTLTIVPYPIALHNTPSDFDGDGKSDISVFRETDGNWYVLNSSNNTFTGIHFGSVGDKIVPGDYDRDGKTDLAVWRQSNVTWYLFLSTAGFTGIQFGTSSDIPAQGDFDGDGKTDVAVFRPSTGTWYLQMSSAGFAAVHFGVNGDRPVPGDYDGDGKTDVAVFRPSEGNWYLLRSTQGFTGIHFGIPTDKVVPGDYDGDGKTDPAVFRDGTWFLLQSTAGFAAIPFGSSGDIPSPGDYDGDGKSDISVFRPSNGIWFEQRSTSGFFATQFGQNGDKPVPSGYSPSQ